MPTYNALEVMDQISAPFQQGLTRAHELQRAAAGARVARSIQIGDLTAKRQYDEGVAQQQHQQAVERIGLAGEMGIKTAEAAAAARTEQDRIQRQQIDDESLVDARGTLHALTKEAATGTGKDAEGNVIGAVETPFTSEQIDGMGKWEVNRSRLKLTEAVQKMHAKKLTRDEAIDFLDGIDPKHKLWWAKKEVLDDDPRNMTKEELADVVGQVKYREFIWKNKEGVVKQYDDLMNEQYRMLYDNGWAAVMTGLDERGQPVALPAGVPANISAVGAMLADKTSTLGLAFQTKLLLALADDPEHFDRVMVELRNGDFTNAVKIATEDADTRGLAGKALADGLATVVEADQSRQLSALQQYLFQKQGDAAKLREVMAATADLVRRHPLLEHGRTPDLPPGSEHLDWMNEGSLRSRGDVGGEQEPWGRGGAEREPQGAGVDIFQTPQAVPVPAPAPVPVSPTAGTPVSPAVGAPVTPTATGAANISGPPRSGFDYAASAAGALTPRSGKWEGGRFQEDKTPMTPIFREPGKPFKMTLGEARGDTGLAGGGSDAEIEPTITGGSAGMLMQKPKGSEESPLELANKVLDETWFTGRLGRQGLWFNRDESPSGRIKQAVTYLESKMDYVSNNLTNMGAYRNEKGEAQISEKEVKPQGYGPLVVGFPGAAKTGKELQGQMENVPKMFKQLDEIKAQLSTLRNALKKAELSNPATF